MAFIQQNVSLKKYNTFGIDVLAKYFLEVNSVSDIQNYLTQKENEPLFVLGGGSNVLFTKNFNGTILKNNLKGIKLIEEDAEHVYVKVGAGEIWHEFVLYCIKNNYAGIENLSLIPGTVGAAPIQNIGAYGVEQADVFFSLEAIDLHQNILNVFTHSDCRFGYRDSVFKHEGKNKFIITSVTFRLNKKPKFNIGYGTLKQELEKMGIKELSIAAISHAVCNIRRSKLPDPSIIGNAGSFFKNPTISNEKYLQLKKDFPNIVAFPTDNQQKNSVKLAAGWLIEQCGWKGKSFGNYGVHKNQALVLVNYDNAKGIEIYELSEKIMQSVKEKFGVTLEREVIIL